MVLLLIVILGLVCLVLYLGVFRKHIASVDIFLIISSCFTALVFADIVLRFVLADTIYYRPHDRLFERCPVYAKAYRYTPNASVSQRSWGDLANLSCSDQFRSEREVSFVTDSHGFRNSSEHSSGEIDLLVLGDSFGVALGTTQTKAWWFLLAEKLNKSLYNLSFPTSPWFEVATLKRELPRLTLAKSATVIWLIFEGNDLDDHSEIQPFEYKEQDFLAGFNTWSDNFARRSPVKMLIRGLFLGCQNADKVRVERSDTFGNLLFYKKYDEATKRDRDEVLSHPGWRNIEVAFAEMKKLQKENNLEVIVVDIPAKTQLYHSNTISYKSSAFGRLLEEESLRHNFDFIELGFSFEETIETEKVLLYWPDDSHWNEDGNNVVADLLAKVLKERAAVGSDLVAEFNG